MSGIRRAAVLANDDWLLQQQLRAEIEAETWRRLRERLAAPEPEPAAVEAPPPALSRIDQIERGGSIILKALVRFGLGVFGAYLAWIAAVDGGLGEFEIWLATGSGFIVALALSMLEPARRFVHLLAETMRFALLAAAGLGTAWLILQLAPGPA
jgi:multisubunit Na+/H+ antiporter MnhB subunit